MENEFETIPDQRDPSKPELVEVGLDELRTFVSSCGQPAYRAEQIDQWVHRHHVRSFEEMGNVPRVLRDALAKAFTLTPPEIIERRQSGDGTVRYVLRFGDAIAETVAIPSDDRLTVCFSTQAGCAMGCAFCATGRAGFSRNLTATEMIDQLAVVARDSNDIGDARDGDTHSNRRRITNAVAMGQGEPFLNYDALIKALRLMNSERGFSIGARKITVSTCGIIEGIERFSREPEQFGLAVSLHCAIQSMRDRLMPAVRSQPLDALHEALLDYQMRTNRRVTLEYALIRNINDTQEALDALREFCAGGLFHVNLLGLHPVDGIDLKPSSPGTIESWQQELSALGIPASVRASRGADINGACGQLAQSIKAISPDH